MTPPNNRYDRLSELDDLNNDAQIFTDETWLQTPDGSWIRSTDKAAKKLIEKARRKGGTVPQLGHPPAPISPPAPPPPPPAEPKRRLGRKEAANRERDAAALRQAEREKQAERERQAERDRQAERERRLEFDKQAEQERQRQDERARKAELERQAELERARTLELEREIERERARAADLERQVELERQRKMDFGTGGYFRDTDQLKTPGPDGRPVSGPPMATPGQTKHAAKSKTKTANKAATKAATKAAPIAKPQAEPHFRPAHERRRTGMRITNGVMAFGLVLATLILGAAINWLSPDVARSQRPFTESASTGQAVDARSFTVTVHAAKAAPAIQVGKSAVASQGAWVIVHVSLAASKEPTHVGYVALRDGAGRTYLATDRISQPLLDGKRTFQPGIGMQGDVVFEVPKDALASLTALFAVDAEHLDMEAVASVGLPSLALDAAPAALAPTEVKP